MDGSQLMVYVCDNCMKFLSEHKMIITLPVRPIQPPPQHGIWNWNDDDDPYCK
jgi:hypothetical protein